MRVATVGVVAAVAAWVRLPLLFATLPAAYDNGVYAMSVAAMRSGARPFRDVFSSQGPTFLPILRGFDILGFERPWAPRLAMVAAGVAIAVGTVTVVRRVRSTEASIALGLAAATSSAVVIASGPLESDGIALAFGIAAVATALSDRQGRAVPIAVGVLAALSIATKSLLIAPAAAVAFWLVWRRRSSGDAGISTIAGVITGLIVTVPFGFAEVWDQFVTFHIAIPQEIAPLQNIGRLASDLVRRDGVALGLGVVAVAWWIIQRRRGAEGGRIPADLTSAAWIWLLGSLGVLILTSDLSSGNVRYIAFVVIPAIILAGASRLPDRVVVAVVVVLLPIQLLANMSSLEGRAPNVDERRVVAAMESLRPGASVVGDDQSLMFLAGVSTPAWLTDTSYARIRAGYLLPDDVAVAVADGDTCAVLIWSGRFDELDPDLAAKATRHGYTDRTDFGDGRVLLARPGCRAG